MLKDDKQTVDGYLAIYYMKLTCEPKGSAELKMCNKIEA